MDSPQLPPPAEQTCPNCGTMAPLDFALCPRCGMQLNAPAKAMYGCITWIFQGTLALFALGFGASGACFSYFGVSAGNEALSFLLIGAVLLLLTWACVWGIIRIGKSRK